MQNRGVAGTREKGEGAAPARRTLLRTNFDAKLAYLMRNKFSAELREAASRGSTPSDHRPS
jgi:hypothetical protein